VRDGSVVFPCTRDCNPRRRLARSRVFEIASSVECGAACSIGFAQSDDPCAYDARQGGVRLDDAAAACIYESLTARFAVYRGVLPSQRDMTFGWQTTGGFRALLASLTNVSSAVLPQHIEYLPVLQSFAIVDGATLGLSLVHLDTLRVERPWPVY